MKTLLLLASIFSFQVSAAESAALKNFVPGEYTLVRGDVKVCGEGMFETHPQMQIVTFGARQGFKLLSGEESLRGNAPGDEACKYKVHDGVDAGSTKTILTFTEQHLCNGAVKHRLTKRAVVQAGRIHLDADQTGNNSFNYSCDWELKSSEH